LLDREFDVPARPGGLDGVREEVDKDVSEPARVADEDRVGRGRVPAHLHVRVPASGPHQRRRFVDELDDVTRPTGNVVAAEIQEAGQVGLDAAELPQSDVQRLVVPALARPDVKLHRQLGPGDGVAELVGQPAGHLAEQTHPFAVAGQILGAPQVDGQPPADAKGEDGGDEQAADTDSEKWPYAGRGPAAEAGHRDQ
jgi:hypothetical protein